MKQSKKVTNANTKGLFTVLTILGYVRYAMVGAIGGMAIYNTLILIATSAPTQSVESIAMGTGALLTTALAKALHVV